MAYFITESCIGCTACSRVCPVDAIAGAARQRHTVNVRRCVSCGTCGSVCPKQAILDGHGKLCHAVPRAKWPKPKVNPVLCSACGICTELGDEAALAEGIRKLMCADPAAMGRRARAYFEAHFDKRMLMDEMDDLFLRC